MSTPLDFIIEIALPWIGRRTRSVALGCLLALGGCEPADDAATSAQTTGREESTLDPHANPSGSEVGVRRELRAGLDRPRLERPGRSQRAISTSRVRRAAPAEVHAGARWSRAADAAWPSQRPDAGGIATSETQRAPSWCGTCHAEVDARSPATLALDEWRLAAMAVPDESHALGGECAHCHVPSRAADWHHGNALDTPGAPGDCTTCHDPHDTSRPHALRVFDTVDDIAGAPAEHLGSGAMCASCHSGGAASGPDGAPHAPQAEVLLGRGARLAAPMDEGAHRFIANTCVRCHMTRPAEDDPLRGRAGGHTFSIRARAGEPAFNAASCAPCHGDTAADAIGMGDWNGDGVGGAIGDEHQRALEVVSERLRARIARLAIQDGCATPRRASDVVERDARLHLVDREGALLGDCDASGRIDADEAPVTTSLLPRRLADAAHDLALLRADGSAGVHNPAYTFRVLDALQRALR